MPRRRAVTLVEVLVVLAIVAVLIGLLLPAIQKVREAATRISSTNNLKQLGLAVHNFNTNRGYLPSVSGAGTPDIRQPLFVSLMPYLDQGNVYSAYIASVGGEPLSNDFTVKAYLSPADPTIEDFQDSPGSSSYAANSQVFADRPRLPGTFEDGTSNTILFAEHYSRKWCDYTYFDWFVTIPRTRKNPLTGEPLRLHRATFADNGPPVIRWDPADEDEYKDVYPITSGSPPVSTSSIPGLTFQVRPSRAECDPRIPQTPHTSGMLVAMGDGSTRAVAPTIAPQVFWGAVTPAGGEVLPDF
jgi:prepilin-type N-terminal cleavage/methylation domain-containing protein